MDKNEKPDHLESGDISNDKALWDLLGSARKVDASPFFARNVLREVRLSEDQTAGVLSRVTSFFKPGLLLGAATAVILAGVFVLQNQAPPVSEPVASVIVEDEQNLDIAEEFASIEMLGELMAVSDPGTLSDEALMNLLF